MTAAEAHDLVALYVLDALSLDEMLEFEGHLAGCVECQEEVTDMRRVTEGLSRTVEADPPASLRESVLAGIAATAQYPRGPESTAVQPSGDEVRRVESHGNVIALRRPWTARVGSLVAAAAVLAAVAFGAFAVQSRHDAQEATAQQAALVSLLGAADVRTVSGTALGGGSGTVVLSSARGKALFVSAGLPALPNGEVYELWTVTTKPVAAGTFSPSHSGTVVTLPSAALTADQIAMTVEPAGGSAHPTSSPVMSVPVPPSR